MNITPEQPQWLVGYRARTTVSTGLHDEIFHRIVVMDDGTTQFCLVSSDLGAVSPAFYDQVASELQRATGVDPIRLWWSVTHTHSAPQVGDLGLPKIFSAGGSTREWDRPYATRVRRALIDGIRQARAALAPARIGVGTGTSMANINRRTRRPDGRIVGGLNPAGPVDRQIGLIRLERPDGTLVALIANYAMHATVLGGENMQISGDWPGAVAGYLEGTLRAPVLIVNGAAGDIAPIHTVARDFQTSRIDEFNALLGDRILAANRSMGAAVSAATLWAGEKEVETPRKAGLGWPEDLGKYSKTSGSGAPEVKLPVRILKISNKTVIWAAPLELFCEVAMNVRARSPFPNTFYFGYTNGWLGYLPTAKGFEEGGYETTVTPFTARAERDLTEGVVSFLQGLARRSGTSETAPQAAAPRVSDVLVDGDNCRGFHMSTRPHNRKVVYHAPSKSWFVFYGTGRWDDLLGEAGYAKNMIAWRRSGDGLSFSPLSPAIVGNGHSSSTDVLLAGDLIYALGFRRNYWQRKAGVLGLTEGEMGKLPRNAGSTKPFFYMPYEIFPFRVAGGGLVAGKEQAALPGDAHVAFEGPHYGSLTRDTAGYIWVAGRAYAGTDRRYATWVGRSRRPDDVTEWEPHQVLFTSGAAGTHAPQVIALDEGRVACVLFVKPEQMTAVFVYDPSSRAWGQPHILGKGYESKRASAVFDPGSRRLHVVYTDEAGAARHRYLAAPYRVGDWAPSLDTPGVLVAEKAGTNPGDDDLSLSADLSRKPAPLALVHRGPDLHLHLRYYDGRNWSPKQVPVGSQDPALDCDEASAVADFSHGFGFLYLGRERGRRVINRKEDRGQLRFGLVKDVAALFAEN